MRFLVDSWQQECVTGLRGSVGGKSEAEGVTLRFPLPEELKHGTEHGDFSRMLIGMPPGGLYESYLLFDNSLITGTAQKFIDEEQAQDAAAAAAEKLELFPQSAEASKTGETAEEGEEKGKTAEAKADGEVEGEGEGESASDKDGADAGAKSVPRKAGAATV